MAVSSQPNPAIGGLLFLHQAVSLPDHRWPAIASRMTRAP